MSCLLRLSVATAVFGGVAMTLGWTDPFFLRFGTPAALMIGAILALVVWVGRPQGEDLEDGLNLLREAVIGAAVGGMWVIAMCVYFVMAVQYSGVILDRRRPQSEQIIERLESKGQWLAVIDVLEEELRSVHSPEWTKTLAERLILNLGRAADADPARAEVLLKRACDVAKAHGLPPDLIDSQLRRLQESRFSQEAVQTAEQRRAAEIAAMEQAASAALHDQLALQKNRFVDNQRALVKQSAESRLHLLSHLLMQAHAPDLLDVRRVAVQEIAALKQLEIPTTSASHQLHQLEAYIRARLPRPMPSDAVLTLHNVLASGLPNVLIVDLIIQSDSSDLATTIRPTDFIVTQAGRRLHQAATASGKSDRTLSIALLPQPIRVGRAARWRVADIEAWMEKRSHDLKKVKHPRPRPR